jgi:hypothetical protein
VSKVNKIEHECLGCGGTEYTAAVCLPKTSGYNGQIVGLVLTCTECEKPGLWHLTPNSCCDVDNTNRGGFNPEYLKSLLEFLQEPVLTTKEFVALLKDREKEEIKNIVDVPRRTTGDFK